MGNYLLIMITLVAGMSAASCGDNGDKLTLLFWQKPSSFNPLHAVSASSVDISVLALEPLANYDEEGRAVPRLVKEVPTVENGGVSEDMLTFTWRLKEGIRWSDGTPLTGEDVVFTHLYRCSLGLGEIKKCSNFDIESAGDIFTVTYKEKMVNPYALFVGSLNPIIQKAQFESCLGKSRQECDEEIPFPVGTGPYRIIDFESTEAELTVTYAKNRYFRTPGNLFSKAIVKAGGDILSYAEAVFETEEADYVWNLQLESNALYYLESLGIGVVRSAFGSFTELLVLNFTNPDPELGEKASAWLDGDNPHPFLTELAVRKAMSLAIDRQRIAEDLYGPAGKATCNLVNSPSDYVSPNNDGCLVQDIEGANRLLDESGWIRGEDGIREKEDVRLRVLFQTTTGSVREETQKLIKGWWEEVGIETELRSLSPSIFFNPDPSLSNIWRFQADVQMFGSAVPGVDPIRSLLLREGSEGIPEPDNNWQGSNYARWVSEEFGDIADAAEKTFAPADRQRIAIRLNDLLVQSYSMIFLINRANVSGFSSDLKEVRMNAVDSELWNIHEWYRESR